MNYTYSPLEYKKQIDIYKELLKISFNKDDDYDYVISKLEEASLKKKEIANIANVIINEYLERFEKNPDLLTIDDLMEEFKKGANTQYSEDVIKALEDETVKKRLEYLVSEGRKDIYYQVYTNNEIKFKK